MTRYHIAINRQSYYSHAGFYARKSLSLSPSFFIDWTVNSSPGNVRTENDFLRRRFLSTVSPTMRWLRGKVARVHTQSKSLNVDACDLHGGASPVAWGKNERPCQLSESVITPSVRKVWLALFASVKRGCGFAYWWVCVVGRVCRYPRMSHCKRGGNGEIHSLNDFVGSTGMFVNALIIESRELD